MGENLGEKEAISNADCVMPRKMVLSDQDHNAIKDCECSMSLKYECIRYKYPPKRLTNT